MKLENIQYIIKTQEDKIISCLNREKNFIFIFSISILAFMVRYVFLDFQSADYIYNLEPWCLYLEENGGFFGIKSLFTDYPVSYIYFLALFTYVPVSYLIQIKLLSIVFDFICAYYVYKIVEKSGNYKKGNYVPLIAFSITLFVPTVIMNSAIWGQCDIIYTTFILITILNLMEEKYTKAFIWFGVAISFKLQAIFVLPVLLLIYLKERKFSFLNFLLIPFSVVLIYIPAIILGKPISQIFNNYYIQIKMYSNSVMNFANLYNLLPDNEQIINGGIFFAISAFVVVYYILFSSKKIKITYKAIVEISLLSILISTNFLPKMHDRYLFVADVLAVIYLILNIETFYVPMFIWFISANCYLPFLFNEKPWIGFKYLSLLNLISLLILLYKILVMKYESKILSTTSPK